MRRACERAVALGLPAIAFTEHLDFTVWRTTTARPPTGLVDRHPAQQRRSTSRATSPSWPRCRERFPELRIWSGVETGEPHLFAASVAAHLRDCPGRPGARLAALAGPTTAGWSGVGQLLWSDPDGTMRRYLGELVDMIESSDVFQVLAHVDFPRRYWPGGHAPVRGEGLRGGVPGGVPGAGLHRPGAGGEHQQPAGLGRPGALVPRGGRRGGQLRQRRPPARRGRADSSTSPSTSSRPPASAPAATGSTSGAAEPPATAGWSGTERGTSPLRELPLGSPG